MRKIKKLLLTISKRRQILQYDKTMSLFVIDACKA